jgi:hypothetical protein
MVSYGENGCTMWIDVFNYRIYNWTMTSKFMEVMRLESGDITAVEFSKLLNVSRATLYRYIKECK